MKEYVYIAIRDEDGKEHPMPPFVVKATPETSAAPEKNSVSNTCVELELKNVDEVLAYLRKHKDIIKPGTGKVELTITPEKSTLEAYNSNQDEL